MDTLKSHFKMRDAGRQAVSLHLPSTHRALHCNICFPHHKAVLLQTQFWDGDEKVRERERRGEGKRDQRGKRTGKPVALFQTMLNK